MRSYAFTDPLPWEVDTVPPAKRSPLDDRSFFQFGKKINGRDWRFQARRLQAVIKDRRLSVVSRSVRCSDRVVGFVRLESWSVSRHQELVVFAGRHKEDGPEPLRESRPGRKTESLAGNVRYGHFWNVSQPNWSSVGSMPQSFIPGSGIVPRPRNNTPRVVIASEISTVPSSFESQASRHVISP